MSDGNRENTTASVQIEEIKCTLPLLVTPAREKNLERKRKVGLTETVLSTGFCQSSSPNLEVDMKIE